MLAGHQQEIRAERDGIGRQRGNSAGIAVTGLRYGWNGLLPASDHPASAPSLSETGSTSSQPRAH